MKSLWKLNNSHLQKKQKFEMWQNLKNQIGINLKLWQNVKTQIMTKLQNSDCYPIQIFKLRQTQKTHIVTKLKDFHGDKALKPKFWYQSSSDKCCLLETTWHLNNRWDLLGEAFCNLAMFAYEGWGMGFTIIIIMRKKEEKK